MTKVKMKIGIKYNQKRVAVGDVIDVSDSVAKRWSAQGIAEIVGSDKKAGGDDLSTPDTSQSEMPTNISAKK